MNHKDCWNSNETIHIADIVVIIAATAAADTTTANIYRRHQHHFHCHFIHSRRIFVYAEIYLAVITILSLWRCYDFYFLFNKCGENKRLTALNSILRSIDLFRNYRRRLRWRNVEEIFFFSSSDFLENNNFTINKKYMK